MVRKKKIPKKGYVIQKGVQFNKAEDERKKKAAEIKKAEAPIDLRQKPTDLKQEPIDLREKKTGIAGFREKETVAGRGVKALTSLKTTAFLGASLATLVSMGLASGTFGGAVGGTATITRTAQILNTGRAGITLTTQRAIVGKATAPAVSKLFGYTVNAKTIGLTTSLLTKTFRFMKNPAVLIPIIGSYPFANFIKEEALQTLSIPIMKAAQAGDLETAKNLTAEVDAMLEDQGNLINKIPFANVIKQLTKFFEAANKANEAWKQIIEHEESIQSGETESDFAKERKKTDEEAEQRGVKELQWKAQYYALIREGKFEEADEFLQEQVK